MRTPRRCTSGCPGWTGNCSRSFRRSRASLAPFNSGNDTITVTSGANLRPDFNRDGTPDFDFTPGITGNVRNALPIILAGQRVYIAAPALTVPTLAITRTGLLINNDFSTPYSQQVNFGVQRELP